MLGNWVPEQPNRFQNIWFCPFWFQVEVLTFQILCSRTFQSRHFRTGTFGSGSGMQKLVNPKTECFKKERSRKRRIKDWGFNKGWKNKTCELFMCSRLNPHQVHRIKGILKEAFGKFRNSRFLLESGSFGTSEVWNEKFRTASGFWTSGQVLDLEPIPVIKKNCRFRFRVFRNKSNHVEADV